MSRLLNTAGARHRRTRYVELAQLSRSILIVRLSTPRPEHGALNLVNVSLFLSV